MLKRKIERMKPYDLRRCELKLGDNDASKEPALRALKGMLHARSELRRVVPGMTYAWSRKPEFDAVTEQAVREAQRLALLKPTGEVDPTTWRAFLDRERPTTAKMITQHHAGLRAIAAKQDQPISKDERDNAFAFFRQCHKEVDERTEKRIAELKFKPFEGIDLVEDPERGIVVVILGTGIGALWSVVKAGKVLLAPTILGALGAAGADAGLHLTVSGARYYHRLWGILSEAEDEFNHCYTRVEERYGISFQRKPHHKSVVDAWERPTRVPGHGAW